MKNRPTPKRPRPVAKAKLVELGAERWVWLGTKRVKP